MSSLGCLALSVVIHALNVVAFYLVGWMLFPEMTTTLAQHFLMVPLDALHPGRAPSVRCPGLQRAESASQLFKLVGHPNGDLAMMGFRVLMYGGGLCGACVYLAKLKEVRELTAAARDEDEPTMRPETQLRLTGECLDRRGDLVTAECPERDRRDRSPFPIESPGDLSRPSVSDLMMIPVVGHEIPHRLRRIVEPEEIMRRHFPKNRLDCMHACAGAVLAPAPGLKTALESIKPAQILEHIKVLASDEFEGRGPGTPGEEKTVAYLTGQFQKMGLKPGNPDGTFVQAVPLVGFQAKQVTGSFQAGRSTIALSFPNDFVAVSRRMAEEVKVGDSDVVFVGYGVVAPEYGWDDYKGLDVRGKTLIMLVNDPPVADPKDPSKLDPAVFKGRAMTYYGRWTYKYEIASEKGAAAAILVHETGPAGYPFEVVKGSWSRENFDIAQPQASQAPNGSRSRAGSPREGQGAVPGLRARLSTRSSRRPPRATSGRCRWVAAARFAITNALREVKSRNVVARLEGSDPALKNETRDLHGTLGPSRPRPGAAGDQIFNGAADNASGVAAVLEIARAFTQVTPAPKRSIVFLAVTAEEKGLLGAKYYAAHPLYPLERTLADINLDVINLWGPTKDLISIGMGNSTLDDMLVEIAKRHGRTVGPDADPEKGYYFRSDHFEFAKQGVPALDPKGGREYIGKPADFGQKKLDEYTAKDYHKVSDEVKPDWDLSGAVEDCQAPGRARLSRRPGGPITPNGSRTASSEPSARRCSRRPNHERGLARAMIAGYEWATGSRLRWPCSLAAAGGGRPPGSMLGTAGSRRPSTPSPISFTKCRCWPGSAGRRSSSWCAGTWPSARSCSCSACWLARRLEPARPALARGLRRRLRDPSGHLDLRRQPAARARAIAAITSKSRPRCSGARGRSSTTSSSFFRDYPHIREGRGGARRLGHAAGRVRACARLPARRPGPDSPARGADRRRQGMQLHPQPPVPAGALRLRATAISIPGSRSGRWPRSPCCRCTRSMPASCSGRAWWR